MSIFILCPGKRDRAWLNLCPNICPMKYKMVFFVLSCMILTGCAVPQTTEISKFTADMNVVRSYRSDLYDRYMKGEIVIDDVYLETDTPYDTYGVDYHVVKFEGAVSGK